MLGCGGRKGRCGKRYERRCRKVCWGVGEVRGDVGKGEVREEMRGSVLGPHTQTHFPTPLPFLPPHPFPTCPILSPISFRHMPTHFPTHPIHSPTLLHSPHTPTHFSTPPPTPPYLFPQLPSPPPTHFPTHPMHSPTPLPTSSPTVSIMWQSYHVTTLP